MEVAKNITKESQEVTRIATVATGACTVGGANDIVDWAFLHNNSDYRPPNFTSFSAELLPLGYQCLSIRRELSMSSTT